MLSLKFILGLEKSSFSKNKHKKTKKHLKVGGGLRLSERHPNIEIVLLCASNVIKLLHLRNKKKNTHREVFQRKA